MSLDRTRHFDVVAVVGRDEVRADKKQDDLCLLKIAIDFGGEFSSFHDPSIVPSIDEILPL
ncbi:MAG TPA: hypothetical protein VJ180_14545 [Pyrinomonadaceae bacterium]|nr:hypothetical protein [Pyrinomonadaceae bacterium]